MLNSVDAGRRLMLRAAVYPLLAVAVVSLAFLLLGPKYAMGAAATGLATVAGGWMAARTALSGGVQAAVALPQSPLAHEDCALARRITGLRTALSAGLAAFHAAEGQDETLRQNQLVEANVMAQFSRLVATEPVKAAWRQGVALDVFGCVYDLQSGHLKELIQQSAEESSP